MLKIKLTYIKECCDMKIEDKIKKLTEADYENGDIYEIIGDKLRGIDKGFLMLFGAAIVGVLIIVITSLTRACTWGLPI